MEREQNSVSGPCSGLTGSPVFSCPVGSPVVYDCGLFPRFILAFENANNSVVFI